MMMSYLGKYSFLRVFGVLIFSFHFAWLIVDVACRDCETSIQVIFHPAILLIGGCAGRVVGGAYLYDSDVFRSLAALFNISQG